MSTKTPIDDGADFETARKMRANAARLLAKMKALDFNSMEYAELMDEYTAECERERKLWRKIEKRFKAKVRRQKKAS